jgi:hypothetical protein
MRMRKLAFVFVLTISAFVIGACASNGNGGSQYPAG